MPVEFKVLDSKQVFDVNGSLEFENHHQDTPEREPHSIKVGEVLEAEAVLVDGELGLLGGD